MKLTYPHLGWAQIRWAPDEDVPEAVVAAVVALDQMPGVKLHQGSDWTQLDVPRNAWTTDAWDVIIDGPNRRKDADQIAAAWALPKYTQTLWCPKQPLYEHQAKAARFLVQHNGGLCADQMGLGKTRVAIVAAQTLASLNGPDRPRVILAPGYTRDVWRRELLAVGAIKDSSELACAFTRSPKDCDFDWDASWWFVHYDIAHWWQGYMATRRPVVAILDEIHWCKNGRAKRSKAAQAIAGTATSRIALTGTPLSNRPAELWWPLTIIDGSQSWGHPKLFRERYCGAFHDGYGLRDGSPTNVPELRERLEHRYIRRTIGEAGVELPELTRRPFLVSMDEKAIKKHADVVRTVGIEKLLRAIMRGSAGEDTLAAITKLRKLTSKVKLDATVQLATDMLEQGESVVIFTWMKKTADQIHDALYKVAGFGKTTKAALRTSQSVHGGHDQAARDDAVRVFQLNGGAMVATLGALREGVTLTAANNLILHDLDWVPANVLQAEARVYRIGQDKPTFVTWMLAEDSVDLMLARCLVEKARVMRETLGIDAAEEAFAALELPSFVGETSVAVELERLFAESAVR